MASDSGTMDKYIVYINERFNPLTDLIHINFFYITPRVLEAKLLLSSALKILERPRFLHTPTLTALAPR